MSPPYGQLPPEGYETQPERDAREMHQRLTDDLEPRTPEVDVRISISKGNPAKVLIDISPERRPAGGRVTRPRGFAGMLLGSVNQHVVAHAACPVVVVR
jgi:nucleotide-binding universal stress UspA family protein